MYEQQSCAMAMEAGIISFKNMKAGFLPFGIKEDKNVDSVINTEVLEAFKTEIIGLINKSNNPKTEKKRKKAKSNVIFDLLLTL